MHVSRLSHVTPSTAPQSRRPYGNIVAGTALRVQPITLRRSSAGATIRLGPCNDALQATSVQASGGAGLCVHEAGTVVVGVSAVADARIEGRQVASGDTTRCRLHACQS